jgi:hypothetical protein
MPSRLLSITAILAIGFAAVAWGLVWRRHRAAAAVPTPVATHVVASTAPDATPPPDASDAPDAPVFDGETVELPAGVKFIVPSRLEYDWIGEAKRTLVFGDGDELVAVINVSPGDRRKKLSEPHKGIAMLAKDEQLSVTSVTDYAPGRIHGQLDGEREGVQLQQHLIFYEAPQARITIYLRLSGKIILDHRLPGLIGELRDGRVLLP